jgi:hypothetical protein
VRESDKKTRARRAQCDALEEWIRRKPEWPYYTAIRTAFVQRFVSWFLSTGDAKKLEKEWTLLANQIFLQPPTIPNRDWRTIPRQQRIVRVLRQILRVTADHRVKGRPISYKRRRATLALDLQIGDPERWTWRNLTDYLCNCDLKEHPANSNCQKDLRRQAVWLKNVLKTMGIKVHLRNKA